METEPNQTTPRDYCPGYVNEPFTTLCREYPGAGTYSPQAFLTEWGPVFHRGRLDGSARLFVLALAPARMELIARRVMVGADGPRMQGLFARLGITRSYVMFNSFLYAIAAAHQLHEHASHPGIMAYRHRWMDALVTPDIEVVISLGGRAHEAWKQWKATPAGQRVSPVHVNITHPTQPESASHGDEERHATAMAAMLTQWNETVWQLRSALKHPDTAPDERPYGAMFTPEDLRPIPSLDLPPGLPDWMRSGEVFAQHWGKQRQDRRRNIIVTAPDPDPVP